MAKIKKARYVGEEVTFVACNGEEAKAYVAAYDPHKGITVKLLDVEADAERINGSIEWQTENGCWCVNFEKWRPAQGCTREQEAKAYLRYFQKAMRTDKVLVARKATDYIRKRANKNYSPNMPSGNPGCFTGGN